jgi:hypothetical protein
VPLDARRRARRARHRKIFAAPDDPADWPGLAATRSTRWRTRPRADRVRRRRLRAPRVAWTRGCFSRRARRLWDELLYDHDAGRFTPERFCAESEREFGGFDGIVLWHAYPCSESTSATSSTSTATCPGSTSSSPTCGRAALRVFVNYNPWDVGTRREPVATTWRSRSSSGARRRRRLPRHDEGGATGLGLRSTASVRGSRSRASRPLSLARICDHHLSWAQWFSRQRPFQACSGRAGSSSVTCSTTRAAGTETTPTSCTVLAERTSACSSGRTSSAPGSVGTSADKQLLRGDAVRTAAVRRACSRPASGRRSPPRARTPALSRHGWRDGETDAVASRTAETPTRRAVGELDVDLPAQGIAAFVGSEQVMVAGGGDQSFPAARSGSRARAVVSRRHASGRVRASSRGARDRRSSARRETGTVRRGAVRRGVEAAAAAAARLRRGRADRRRGRSRSPVAA